MGSAITKMPERKQSHTRPQVTKQWSKVVNCCKAIQLFVNSKLFFFWGGGWFLHCKKGKKTVISHNNFQRQAKRAVLQCNNLHQKKKKDGDRVKPLQKAKRRVNQLSGQANFKNGHLEFIFICLYTFFETSSYTLSLSVTMELIS